MTITRNGPVTVTTVLIDTPGAPLKPYTVPPGHDEHPDVTRFRELMAADIRAWHRAYVNDPTVDDATYCAEANHMELELVRKMAQLAWELAHPELVTRPDSFALRRPKRRYPVTGPAHSHGRQPTA